MSNGSSYGNPRQIPAYQPYAPREKEPPRSYTWSESVFAWLCWGLGFVFWRLAFPAADCPLGSLIFLWLAFGCAGIFLKCRGAKFRWLPVTAMVTALALSPALVVSSNDFIHFWTFAYGAAAWCYFVGQTAGAPERIRPGRLAADTLRAAVLPLASMGNRQFFRGMFSRFDRKKNGTLLKVLAGIAIALIPTAVVVALLSYDRAFTDLLKNLMAFDWLELLGNLLSLVLGLPVGMYLFGMYLSAADHKLPDMLSEERCDRMAGAVKIMPMVTAVTAVVPLLAVYVLFFVSQWKYYVSGFTGVLPEGFSYAQYAREGFFQLCIVSVINMAAILLVLLLMKRGRGARVLLQVMTTVFTVFTLVLIATAMAKLWMYIDSYGLTQRRVYAAWFMVVLGLIFVVLTVSRFVPKVSAMALTAAVVLAAFGGLALCNADALIATYNADRYLNGTLSSLDAAALGELKEAGVPEMVRLAKYLDEKNGTDITKMTYKEAVDGTDLYHGLAVELMYVQEDLRYMEQHADQRFCGLTLNYLRAEAAMKELGTMQEVTWLSDYPDDMVY